MKKSSVLLLALLLLLAAAFAEEIALPTFIWEHDGLTHWQLDTDGAVINQGAHNTADSWLCSICGADILDWGDGTYDVSDYDEYGNLVRSSCYDENGLLTYQSIHVLTCNEDGVILKDVEYINGVLYGESLYTVTEDGMQLPVSSTVWNDDGTTSVNQYDKHGNCVYAAIYEADGSVFFETISEFALSDDGWYYECTTTSRYATGETFYDETNQYGDKLRSLNTHADGTVWGDWTYEYEYRNHTKVWKKQYAAGVLIFEEFFDDDGNCIQEVEYLEDGGWIIYDYNDHGDVASVATYAADGSLVSTETREYEYEEDEALDWFE